MNTLEEALKHTAKVILKRGETKNKGSLCIVPSYYAKDKESIGSKAFDILYKAKGATHFDVTWLDVDAFMVTLTLYKGEAFGACRDVEPIAEYTVSIKEDK